MKIEELFKTINGVYVIAEVAQSHDGSLGQAHAFIDAVADAGASAVKFQTHIAEAESTRGEPFRVKFSLQDGSRYDYWKRMEFTKEQWIGLYKHATERGIDFLSSPFSIEALQMLEDIGIRAWKLGSGEVFNLPLLEKAVATGKPILLSSGMSTYRDIEEQVNLIKSNKNDLLIFQCTTKYPTAAQDVGLNVLTEFKERFDCKVGLSDHSGTIFPGIAAAALGADAVEVHVVLSRQMFGPDVTSSITTEELKALVNGLDFTNEMIRHPINKGTLNPEFEKMKLIFSKGIYARTEISQGEVFTLENIAFKKPAGNISASRYKELLGRRAKTDVQPDDAISWDSVE